MNERSKLISRLLHERDFRASYIRAKLDVLIPSQLRALRLRQEKTQPEIAQMAGMLQSRISAMETPGKVNFNLETLVRMGAALKVGLLVEFVPFSEMLDWENEYNQDTFDVAKLDDDIDFLQPAAVPVRRQRRRRARSSSRAMSYPNYPVATGSAMQMRFQFEPPGEPPIQDRLGNIVFLPKRSDSVLGDVPLKIAAAAAGARRNYAIGK